jgi:hypothetical protein
MHADHRHDRRITGSQDRNPAAITNPQTHVKMAVPITLNQQAHPTTTINLDISGINRPIRGRTTTRIMQESQDNTPSHKSPSDVLWWMCLLASRDCEASMPVLSVTTVANHNVQRLIPLEQELVLLCPMLEQRTRGPF